MPFSLLWVDVPFAGYSLLVRAGSYARLIGYEAGLSAEYPFEPSWSVTKLKLFA